MPGRRPHPIELLEINNDKRHLTKAEIEKRKAAEPKIKANTLRCPGHLTELEQKEWRRIIRLYKQIDTNILCDLDSNNLEMYVVAFVRWKKAQEKIRTTSEILSSGTNAFENPWIGIEKDARAACIKLSSLLMLDVVSRARVGNKKEVEDDSDGLGKFINRREVK